MVTEEKRRDPVIFNLKENKSSNKEDVKMKFKFMGIGAAGNKACMALIERGVVTTDDVVLVNSTKRDIPKDFKGKVIILSPDGNGCGKERQSAREYAIMAMRNNAFDNLFDNETDNVLIVTSVEGGTGSGSTPIIGQYCSEVLAKNVHIVAFTGFEEDPRGMENTVEFFQEIDFTCSTQCIRNTAFLSEAENNKFVAEQLANDEFVSRVETLLGKGMVDSSQNIDDTDIFKVVATNGYKTVERIEFDEILMDVNKFNKLCEQMIYSSKSLKTTAPGQIRMGVILNIKPESENAIDFNFKVLKTAYGSPYESFFHKQYDGGKQYIRVICSGMKLPLDEVIAIHERCVKASEAVNTSEDDFFNKLAGLSAGNNSKFNMTRSSNAPGSKENFLKKLETQPK